MQATPISSDQGLGFCQKLIELKIIDILIKKGQIEHEIARNYQKMNIRWKILRNLSF